MPPEPNLSGADQGAHEGACRLLADLQARLEAGDFGFTQNPDQEYQEYVGQ